MVASARDADHLHVRWEIRLNLTAKKNHQPCKEMSHRKTNEKNHIQYVVHQNSYRFAREVASRLGGGLRGAQLARITSSKGQQLACKNEIIFVARLRRKDACKMKNFQETFATLIMEIEHFLHTVGAEHY